MGIKQIFFAIVIILSCAFCLLPFSFAETTKHRRSELTKLSIDISTHGDFSYSSFSLYEHMRQFSRPSFMVDDSFGEFSSPSLKIRSSYDRETFSKPGFKIREKSDKEFSTPSFSIYKNRGKNKGEFSEPSFRLRTNQGEFSRPLYDERSRRSARQEYDYDPVKY